MIHQHLWNPRTLCSSKRSLNPPPADSSMVGEQHGCHPHRLHDIDPPPAFSPFFRPVSATAATAGPSNAGPTHGSAVRVVVEGPGNYGANLGFHEKAWHQQPQSAGRTSARGTCRHGHQQPGSTPIAAATGPGVFRGYHQHLSPKPRRPRSLYPASIHHPSAPVRGIGDSPTSPQGYAGRRPAWRPLGLPE